MRNPVTFMLLRSEVSVICTALSEMRDKITYDTKVSDFARKERIETIESVWERITRQVNGFLNSLDCDAHAQLQAEIERLTKINSGLHEELGKKEDKENELWDKINDGLDKIAKLEKVQSNDGVRWNKYPDVRPVDGAVCIVTVDEYIDVRVAAARYKAHEGGILSATLSEFYSINANHPIYRVIGWYIPQPMQRVSFEEVNND